jgi:hypothetical protein
LRQLLFVLAVLSTVAHFNEPVMAWLSIFVMMAAMSTTAAVCSSSLNPEETDVAFLLDGSFSVSSAAFASRKDFAIAIAAEMGRNNVDNVKQQFSALEYSNFACASTTQCTPFVGSALELEDDLASVDRSFGGISRLGAAILTALSTRFSSNSSVHKELVVLTSTASSDSLSNALNQARTAQVDVLLVGIDQVNSFNLSGVTNTSHVKQLFLEASQVPSPNAAVLQDISDLVACPGTCGPT